jgi:histone deacetylase 1/2
MSSTSALALALPSGATISVPNASTSVGLSASSGVSVRLDTQNFMLWKGLTVPALAGAGLHGHIDGTTAAPTQTIKEGTGDAAVDVPNPEYSRWWVTDQWVTDQRVLSFLLGSMEPVMACQLIGCTSAMDVWAAVHRLYGAQSRANVRHVRHQLQSLHKEGMPAAQYMQPMKALGDVMAAADSPLSNDVLVDYIITGLGKEFNTITATLTLGNKSVPYDEFYSHILSFEALQEQQDQSADWSSSANFVSRPGLYSNPGRPRAPEFPAGASRQPGAYQPVPGYSGNGRPYGGQGNAAPPGGQHTGGQAGGRHNYGGNDGGSRQNNHRRQRPQCQICNYWGHVALDCRNRFNPEFQPRNNNN